MEHKKNNLKKIMLLSMVIMITVLCSNMAKGDLCYQETANQSHASDGSCSLDYSGYYLLSGTWTNPGNLYDGNWSSYGSSSNGELYINYTKPPNALNSSLWRTESLEEHGNVTISSDIWEHDPDILQFKIETFAIGPAAANYWYGWNGTKWVKIFGFLSEGPFVVEEAMWWNVTSTCSCPGSDQNWEINMGENCIIESDCNIGIGNLTFTSSGNVSINALVTTANMGVPPADSIVYINGSGKITITS